MCGSCVSFWLLVWIIKVQLSQVENISHLTEILYQRRHEKFNLFINLYSLI